MEKKPEKNKWKTIAIIFIILFVLETLAIVYVYKVGADANAHEAQCANEICYILKADTYFYEPYEGVCQCFKDEKEIYNRRIA